MTVDVYECCSYSSLRHHGIKTVNMIMIFIIKIFTDHSGVLFMRVLCFKIIGRVDDDNNNRLIMTITTARHNI